MKYFRSGFFTEKAKKENFEEALKSGKYKNRKYKEISKFEYILFRIPVWIFNVFVLIIFALTLPFWWINEKIDENITFFRN